VATKKLIQSSRELSFLYQKPVTLCLITDSSEWFMMKNTADFPTFTEPDDALRGLALSLTHHRNTLDHDSHSHDKFELRRVRGQRRRKPSKKILGTGEVFELLKDYGLPVADYEFVEDYKEGLEAAELIGYPVVLKTANTTIVHKTDVGGVWLNIGNPDTLKAAFQAVKGDRFLVQKMVDPGYEVIIGGKCDSEFGAVVVFGMGGIFVEALKDIVLKVAPITDGEANEMIEGVKGSVLLKGFRGGPVADIDALRRCLVNVSRLLHDRPEIQTLDINPLIVLKGGQGCVVVDAKALS
jgi:acyl-CoA synthetase (NDP forming)